MKLSLPENFLWKIFNLAQGINQVTSSRLFLTLSRPKTVYYKPEWVDYVVLKNEFAKINRQRQFSRLIHYLKRKGLIKINSLKTKKAVMITLKGQNKISRIASKVIDRPKRKDKKWQMVIFDIPENYHKTRDRFRRAIKMIGYKKLQQSIWICPYDVLAETESLIKNFSIEDWVRLLLVEEIDL